MKVYKYCPKGHAYDSSLPSCPHCQPVGNSIPPTSAANPHGGGVPSTMPVSPYQSNQSETQVSDELIEQSPAPVPPTTPVGSYQNEQTETQVSDWLIEQSPVVTGSPMNTGNQYVGGIPPTTPIGSYQNEQTETQVADELIEQSSATGKQQPKRVSPVVGWLVCVKGDDIGKDFRLHANFNHVGRNGNMDIQLTDPYVSRDKHFTVSYDLHHNRYFVDMGQGKSFVHINGHPLGGRTQIKKGDQIQVGKTLLVFIPLEEQDLKWNWNI